MLLVIFKSYLYNIITQKVFLSFLRNRVSAQLCKDIMRLKTNKQTSLDLKFQQHKSNRGFIHLGQWKLFKVYSQIAFLKTVYFSKIKTM